MRDPLAHVRTFGCAAFVHLVHTTGPNVDKWDPKSVMHVLLGWDDEHQCYRLALPPNYKIVYSAHVTFQEELFPCKQKGAVTEVDNDFLPRTSGDDAQPHQEISAALQRPRREWMPSAAALENIADASSVAVELDAADICNTLSSISSEIADVPASTYDALRLPEPEGAEWRQSLIDEYTSHEKNGTLGPECKVPDGFKAIPVDFVLKKKRADKQEKRRKKVRAVVKGFHMKQGRDYNDTFAPVPNITILRILLVLTTMLGWAAVQGDVRTAFLCATMDTVVYVAVPRIFNKNPSADQTGYTYHRLLKAIPGIPQGPRLFNQKSHGIYTKNGLTRCTVEHCFYYCKERLLYLVVWVDDIFLFFPPSSTNHAERLWAELQKDLDLDAWEDINDCLACNVTRNHDKKTLTLSQAKAIRATVKRAGLDYSNKADTPIVAGASFTKKDCPAREQDRLALASTQTWYRSMLASCIYFCTWTRPDIAFAISKLCKFMQNPGEKHITALKRLLRYLNDTADKGLVFNFSSAPAKQGLYGYYDASFADDVDTRRSTIAYVFFLFGCPISWNSKLHSYITTSTNHSEYCAAARACKEAKWLSMLMQPFDCMANLLPIPLFSDSQGAIAMCYNPAHKNASKHVDLADHYAREQVERGLVVISYVDTKAMIADALTKALPLANFDKHAKQLVKNVADFA